MRIGIDARLMTGRFTGDRTYWRGLIEGMARVDSENEYLLYTATSKETKGRPKLPANFRFREVEALSGRVWSLWALPKAAKADGADLVHVQYTVSPFFDMPVVTTIHDITFRLFPKLFSAKNRLLLNLSVPAAVRRAHRVIAVSESTRRDILAAYHPALEKVVATPLAAGAIYHPLPEDQKSAAREMLAKTYGWDGPFAIAVGVLQPRKNLPMLIHAFRAARKAFKFPHRLAVVGKKGWLTADIDQALASAPSEEIVMTGYVPDEHLPLLYSCADAMCYPSLYEGFGLPPLEAMACGCPALASNTSSLPEVVGEGGLLLDPAQPGEWIDAIGSVLTDSERRDSLREAGIRQASRFDWTKTAEATLRVYREVVK